MLTADERREIEAEVARMPEPPAAAVEALKVVQRRRGWVDDEALAEVADALGLSPAAVENVATFYSLIFRRPVGRHVVLLCDSVSCWVMGAEELRAAVEVELGISLGETTPDGDFTLLTIPCLGACDGAPAMMVDTDLHLRVRPAAVAGLLAPYRDRGDDGGRNE